MGESRHNVGACGRLWESRYVQVACVGGLEDGTVGYGDGDGVVVDLFVDDVCVCQDEVACGSGVPESVLCGYWCCGVDCGMGGGGFVVVVVVVVVVAEEGKTIVVR